MIMRRAAASTGALCASRAAATSRVGKSLLPRDVVRGVASLQFRVFRDTCASHQVRGRGIARALSASATSGASDKLRVVLDMDECMIYSTFDDEEENEYRQVEERRIADEEMDRGLEKFKIVMSDGEGCVVRKRPYLNEFLEVAKTWSWCELSAFTAGTRDYASRVLDVLDPDGSVFKGGRFYREHCTLYSNRNLFYLKDIRKCLGPEMQEANEDDALARIVLVDNNPISFVLQPRNAILVPSWYGDASDNVFQVLPDIICALRDEPDVRVAMERHPGAEYTQKIVGEYRKHIMGDNHHAEGGNAKSKL